MATWNTTMIELKRIVRTSPEMPQSIRWMSFMTWANDRYKWFGLESFKPFIMLVTTQPLMGINPDTLGEQESARKEIVIHGDRIIAWLSFRFMSFSFPFGLFSDLWARAVLCHSSCIEIWTETYFYDFLVQPSERIDVLENEPLELPYRIHKWDLQW